MPLSSHTDFLNACILSTEECLTHCIEKNHKECARFNRDCADFCMLMTRLRARKSDMFYRLIPLCIETCKECLLVCDKIDDIICQSCARACANCINNLRLLRN